MRYGYSIIPVSYWGPIPSLENVDLDDSISKDILMPIDFVHDFAFVTEQLSALPSPIRFPEHIEKNPMFPSGDIMAYFAMINYYRPNKIIEIGGGYSTCLAHFSATLLNLQTEILCIEPEPNIHLAQLALENKVSLSRTNVQNITENEIEQIKSLRTRDILFIDASHVTVRGSDTNYIFLNILPLLSNDILVHIHDIFLPYDYDRNMYYKAGRFYSEQYLLASILADSNFYLPLYSSFYSFATRQTDFWGASFWMKRRER
jgi:hypothetical protein